MVKLRLFLLKCSIPLQKFIQKIHPPEPNLRYLEAFNLRSLMKTGDILISKNHYRLTNLFIPGYWSHAAIYDGHRVIEAVGGGVQAVHPIEWMLKTNDFAILRPNADLSAEANYKLVLWLNDKIGKPYDYLFFYSQSGEAFYCSELVFLAWKSIEHICFWTKGFTLKETFGVPTVVADDFYNAVKSKKLTLIHEHYQWGKK